MKNETKLTSNMEDYLETILILEQKNRVARVKDISDMLEVKMPSVTGALKILREQGFINYEKNSYINLTENGMRIARCILERHKIILRFLNVCLKLEGEWVENQACMIEHSINHETALRLEKLTDWIEETAFNEKNLSQDEWLKILHE